MKELFPYKQVLSHGCLAACFLMLLDTRDKKRVEKELLLRAMNRRYAFYISGVPTEISKTYGKKITVFVDNNYFTTILKKEFRGTKVKPVHNKISLTLIKHLLTSGPVICHIDDHYLGDYSHASHFIIIEKDTGKKFLIIDPWHGKKRLISHKKIEESIMSLKKHVKMCPLLLIVR